MPDFVLRWNVAEEIHVVHFADCRYRGRRPFVSPVPYEAANLDHALDVAREVDGATLPPEIFYPDVDWYRACSYCARRALPVVH